MKNSEVNFIQEIISKDSRSNKINDKNTTSDKFKIDLFEFFSGKSYKNCVEIGTYEGRTTKILSYCFDKVYTIDNNQNCLEESAKYNQDRINIEHIKYNLYSNSNMFQLPEYLEPMEFDLYVIDAGHEYNQVSSDINRCINHAKKESYICFDDYGLNTVPGVNKAVSDFVMFGKLEIVKTIGREKGYDFGKGRYLSHADEGVICKIIKN